MTKRISLNEKKSLIAKLINENKIINVQGLVKLSGICKSSISTIVNYYMNEVREERVQIKGKIRPINFYYFGSLTEKKKEIIESYRLEG